MLLKTSFQNWLCESFTAALNDVVAIISRSLNSVYSAFASSSTSIVGSSSILNYKFKNVTYVRVALYLLLSMIKPASVSQHRSSNFICSALSHRLAIQFNVFNSKLLSILKLAYHASWYRPWWVLKEVLYSLKYFWPVFKGQGILMITDPFIKSNLISIHEYFKELSFFLKFEIWASVFLQTTF